MFLLKTETKGNKSDKNKYQIISFIYGIKKKKKKEKQLKQIVTEKKLHCQSWSQWVEMTKGGQRYKLPVISKTWRCNIQHGL